MTCPELDADLFDDAARADPSPLYRAIRDRRPAVWLPRYAVWAIGRFDDARRALRADDLRQSGQGVGLNDMGNGQPARVTLTSDGTWRAQRGSGEQCRLDPLTPALSRRRWGGRR